LRKNFHPEVVKRQNWADFERAIKMDGSLRAEFLEDCAFDAVWDSF